MVSGYNYMITNVHIVSILGINLTATICIIGVNWIFSELKHSEWTAPDINSILWVLTDLFYFIANNDSWYCEIVHFIPEP